MVMLPGLNMVALAWLMLLRIENGIFNLDTIIRRPDSVEREWRWAKK